MEPSAPCARSSREGGEMERQRWSDKKRWGKKKKKKRKRKEWEQKRAYKGEREEGLTRERDDAEEGGAECKNERRR